MDNYPEAAFFNVGTIDKIKAKGGKACIIMTEIRVWGLFVYRRHG